MSRGLSGEDANFDAGVETVPQWLLTTINFAGMMVLALLRM